MPSYQTRDAVEWRRLRNGHRPGRVRDVITSQRFLQQAVVLSFRADEMADIKSAGRRRGVLGYRRSGLGVEGAKASSRVGPVHCSSQGGFWLHAR